MTGGLPFTRFNEDTARSSLSVRSGSGARVCQVLENLGQWFASVECDEQTGTIDDSDSHLRCDSLPEVGWSPHYSGRYLAGGLVLVALTCVEPECDPTSKTAGKVCDQT